MNNVIDKIKEMGLEEDEALDRAIDGAKNVDELIAVLAARGISATKEELLGVNSEGELTEDALENVAGGWFGFFGGYSDGMSGGSKKYNNPVYSLGYKCGRLIGGYSTTW